MKATLGVVIVDHGSRLEESNRLLEEVAAAFGRRYGDRCPIVEPAHMEIAEPSIAAAYARCVARGATRVVVLPFFLGPGKHITNDIPRIAAAAAAAHRGTTVTVAPPLGLDDLVLDLLAKRLAEAPGGATATDSRSGGPASG